MGRTRRGSSCIRILGLASVSIACTTRSRVVISQRKRDRRFERGQVARDPEGSGFGTSATSKSKGAQRDREVPSCDGTHGSCVERNTWHRAFGARRLEEQVFGITSSDTPRIDRGLSAFGTSAIERLRAGSLISRPRETRSPEFRREDRVELYCG